MYLQTKKTELAIKFSNNNMAKRTLLILAAASLMFPLGAYAAQLNTDTNNSPELKLPMKQELAQHHSHRGKRQHKGERMNQMLQQLNLTPEQSQRIEAIKEEFQTKNAAIDEQMEDNYQERRGFLTSDASVEELRAKHQEIQTLRQQLGNNRFEMMLELREVLTPEQRSQLAELMEQKRNRRGS